MKDKDQSKPSLVPSVIQRAPRALLAVGAITAMVALLASTASEHLAVIKQVSIAVLRFGYVLPLGWACLLWLVLAACCAYASHRATLGRRIDASLRFGGMAVLSYLLAWTTATIWKEAYFNIFMVATMAVCVALWTFIAPGDQKSHPDASE